MESLPPSLRKEGWKRCSAACSLRQAHSPGGAGKTQVLAEQTLRGLRICIPEKLPSDVSAAVGRSVWGGCPLNSKSLEEQQRMFQEAARPSERGRTRQAVHA